MYLLYLYRNCATCLIIEISPMGGGSDGISPRDQQSPVVTSVSRGDVVVNALDLNGGIGDPHAIPYVRNCTFDPMVNLWVHADVHAW